MHVSSHKMFYVLLSTCQTVHTRYHGLLLQSAAGDAGRKSSHSFTFICQNPLLRQLQTHVMLAIITPDIEVSTAPLITNQSSGPES